jgi:hypothetical protein
VLKSAWPVGYNVGKAMAKIRSLSSMGVSRMEGAGRPGAVFEKLINTECLISADMVNQLQLEV